MAEVRDARRAAERAARERLGGPLINAAGELGVAAARREAAAAGVAGAQQQAREHLARAQAEADRMVADARAAVTAADEQYQRAHEEAVAAGWAPSALTDMGYPAPPTPQRPRGPRGRGQEDAPTPGGAGRGHAGGLEPPETAEEARTPAWRRRRRLKLSSCATGYRMPLVAET